MYNKIVLAGGSGYLGQVLAKYWQDRSREVVVLSRRAVEDRGLVKTVLWDGRTLGGWASCLEGADLVVNLSGKNVNCRYTDKNKDEIFRSRLEPTAVLGEAIRAATDPPKLWINAASATIYRHAEDRPQDELSGEIGTGFSVDVCKAWEAEFNCQSTPRTRKITLRVSLVLGPSDGVYPRLRNLARLGLGGPQGSGSQYFSWIHEDDFVRLSEWLLERTDLSGVFNVAAPEALPNRAFMQMLRRSFRVVIGLPAPGWLLELGARIIGTETELILKSRWVKPARLLKEGFQYRFAGTREALTDLARRRI